MVKRRSSFIFGDKVKSSLKGNRFYGDGKYLIGKSYWTISRKVYPICYHQIYYFEVIELSNESEKNNRKLKRRWLLKISIVTLVITYLFGRLSDIFVRNFDNFGITFLSILIIIVIGVISDTIGVAVAAADHIPFLSMASKKIRGANHALILIRNASQVSSFCNDVVGDICGILSGSAGAILVSRIVILGENLNDAIVSIMISSIIATLTVAGKAYGKTFAIEKSQEIMLSVGYILSIFDKRNSKRETRKTKRKE